MDINKKILTESVMSILNLNVAMVVIGLNAITVAITLSFFPNNAVILLINIILVSIITLLVLTANNYIKKINEIKRKQKEDEKKRENFKKLCDICTEANDY